MKSSLPFKISTLVFIRDRNGKHLLIKRLKAPNKGCWSPIGGKLNMPLGESPYECARREAREEVGITLTDEDLNCFGYVSEKAYEGTGHWLMFLFNCKKSVDHIPERIDEGHFDFFSRKAVNDIPIPESDRTLIWPYFDKYCNGFVGLRANCKADATLEIIEELKID